MEEPRSKAKGRRRKAAESEAEESNEDEGCGDKPAAIKPAAKPRAKKAKGAPAQEDTAGASGSGASGAVAKAVAAPEKDPHWLAKYTDAKRVGKGDLAGLQAYVVAQITDVAQRDVKRGKNKGARGVEECWAGGPGFDG